MEKEIQKRRVFHYKGRTKYKKIHKDHMDFQTRKSIRTQNYYENIHGVSIKEIQCTACGGNGYYDACRSNGNSIICSECNGTGKEINYSKNKKNTKLMKTLMTAEQMRKALENKTQTLEGILQQMFNNGGYTTIDMAFGKNDKVIESIVTELENLGYVVTSIGHGNSIEYSVSC
jgi:hypothetical protein